MNLIAVDDEPRALMNLEHTLKRVIADGSVVCFTDPSEALGYARGVPVDVALLDINMPGMSGLELALRLKAIAPKVNIIFVTAYSDYAGNAFSLRASGYLLKPVGEGSIRVELENLRYPIQHAHSSRVVIKCFGNFEVFLDDEPLLFSRSKCKELLAYLVDRGGSGVTVSEISSVLWENRKFDRSMQKQVQTIISTLMRRLREAGVGDIVIKQRNYLAIDKKKVDCDYYAMLDGDVPALNQYRGEYMSNYSWAEYTAAYLSRKQS